MTEWYVYLLECADRTLYTGITTDLERRVGEHNAGSGAKYTASRTPVVLVYSEKAPSRSRASQRERAIKRMTRAAKLQFADDGHAEQREITDRIEHLVSDKLVWVSQTLWIEHLVLVNHHSIVQRAATR